jgi:alginate O-acetyltransferase complex protein AlgI
MVFSSTIFLFVFLPLFLIGTLVSSRISPNARNLNIVVFSLAFYVFGAGLYTAILIASIFFNWMFAPLLASRKQDRLLLALGLAINLLPLLVFKYLGFLFDLSSRYFLTPFLSLELPAIKLFLPAGISFYTFQAISYLMDVRRGEIPPERSLLDFAAYTLLFPQLVAGPIVRYAEIREKLHQASIDIGCFNAGIFFFGTGLARKMLLADPLGRLSDQIYGLPATEITNLMAWIGTLAYSLQIFFDFSGYSAMAIGLGLMIGFDFPDNFNQPYRAHSLTDFWRRWHMTLSRWFRDYLYIPLGGNRKGSVRTLFNLWIVFLLCGLWHGAALTFVAWGAWHGLLLLIERLAKSHLGFEPRGLPGSIATLLLVMVGWVLFRSSDFDQAGYMLAKLAFIDTNGVSLFAWPYYLSTYHVVLFAIAGSVAVLPLDRWQLREKLASTDASWAALGGLALLILAMAALADNGFNPFIYFQF